MAVFVVTWDLNLEKPHYAQARAKFVTHLQTLENVKEDGLDSVRFISTLKSANQLNEYLRQKMDTNDCLFVSKLREGEHQGWLSQATWDWINARL